jgi:hypothetical protein
MTVPEIPDPVLPPVVLQTDIGGPIDIRGGTLRSTESQLAFLGRLMTAVRLNLESEARRKLCSTQSSAPA